MRKTHRHYYKTSRKTKRTNAKQRGEKIRFSTGKRSYCWTQKGHHLAVSSMPHLEVLWRQFWKSVWLKVATPTFEGTYLSKKLQKVQKFINVNLLCRIRTSPRRLKMIHYILKVVRGLLDGKMKYEVVCFLRSSAQKIRFRGFHKIKRRRWKFQVAISHICATDSTCMYTRRR